MNYVQLGINVLFLAVTAYLFWQLHKKNVLLEERAEEIKQKSLAVARLAEVGEFADRICHDLAGYVGVAESYLDMLTVSESQTEYFSGIRRADEHTARLIDELRRFIRGDVARVRSLWNVRQLFEEVITLHVLRRFHHLNIQVDNKIPDDMQIVADEGIKRVVMNLLVNACEAMIESPRRELALESDGREVAIRDSGCGIPPQHIERVFDTFFTTKKEGTGLGMTSVRQILKDNGVSISLESSVGEGTTVRLVFPEVQQVPLRMLAVDCDPEAREVMRNACESEGHEFCEVTEVRSALQTALQTEPTIVFVGDLGGDAEPCYLVESIRSRFRDIPIVAIVKGGDEKLSAALKKAGASECMPGPLYRDAVASLLRQSSYVVGDMPHGG